MGEVVAFRRREESRDGRPRSGRSASGTDQPPPPTPKPPPTRFRPTRESTERQPARHRDPLWRELVGEVLRRRRIERSETQRQVADRAGISVQYLSELERGRKEPSSEMLAAVGGALDLPLLDLTRAVGRRLLRATGRPTGPVALAA